MLVALFDWLEERWDGPAALRVLSRALVVAFLGSIAAIELGRQGLLPAALARSLPRTHFRAVELAFYLLLSWEVVGLVFGIARSVSSAAGKQIEIFSLILLRSSFEAFSTLEWPLRWREESDVVLKMLADAAGALAIFVVLGLYYRLLRHRPLAPDEGDRLGRFVRAKKVIALALLAAFAVIGLRSVASLVVRHEGGAFFEAFYTLLIFADVLVVLISLRYSSTYHAVFRNSGLTVATLLLRMALTAPPFLNALLGTAAALFALGLTAAYNAFAPAAPPVSRPAAQPAAVPDEIAGAARPAAPR